MKPSIGAIKFFNRKPYYTTSIMLSVRGSIPVAVDFDNNFPGGGIFTEPTPC
jgi:hypothetical protein